MSAGAIDNGAEMVARGIDTFEDLKAQKLLEVNFGVDFGNTSDMEELTPSQKLVYMIATANQSPFKVDWVKDTFSHDVIYYYIICICIIIVTVGLDMAQKDHPELIADISNKFTGHDGFFDYSTSFKTTLKLALYPIIAFASIETLLSFEQALSSGLMTDSLEYISFSTGTVGIWMFESVSYVFNGALFGIRIQYINEFTANLLKLIIMFVVPWGKLAYFAEMLGAWFCSALFMRPIVLWYSSKAVKHISEQTSTAAKIAATASDMPVVSLITFITAIVLVLGPFLLAVFKILVQYAIGAGYKVMKISNELNKYRRSRT